MPYIQNIPWQIYADWLEDHGYDTRLFRKAEPRYEANLEGQFHDNGNGWGCGYGNIQ